MGLTMEVWMITRSSSRLPWLLQPVQNTMGYWYMLEIFTDHDNDKDGIIKMAEFPAMMNEFLTVPNKHNLTVPAEGQYETLFKKYDPRNDGRLTVDEWMKLASEEVYKKY